MKEEKKDMVFLGSGVSNYDDIYVFFCYSEEEAKNFILLPGDTVVDDDIYYLPEDIDLPAEKRRFLPIRRRDVSRIQVEYIHASPIRVRQMSITAWKRHFGLLPKRKKLPFERPLCIEALASCMMKNGVR